MLFIRCVLVEHAEPNCCLLPLLIYFWWCVSLPQHLTVWNKQIERETSTETLKQSIPRAAPWGLGSSPFPDCQGWSFCHYLDPLSLAALWPHKPTYIRWHGQRELKANSWWLVSGVLVWLWTCIVQLVAFIWGKRLHCILLHKTKSSSLLVPVPKLNIPFKYWLCISLMAILLLVTTSNGLGLRYVWSQVYGFGSFWFSSLKICETFSEEIMFSIYRRKVEWM